MSTQMTVRLSDESAAFIDSLVREGKAASRAAALDKLVRRQKRRVEAEEDLRRYTAIPLTEEERELGEWGSRNAAEVWASLD